MKTIDYLKSKGSFKIKYLDENEIYKGTINVDDKSLKTDLVKYIIDNEENSVFSYKTKIGGSTNSVDILILEKDITLYFEEVNEEIYFKYHYNENDTFKNIKYEDHLTSENIYFQFYYKAAEHKVNGTISNRIINGLKKYPVADCYNQYGYIEDYNFFRNIYFHNFLKKYNLIDHNIICCVPSHTANISNNGSLALMIKEICKNTTYIDGSQLLIRNKSIPAQKNQRKRFEETHIDSINISGDVKGKKIILIDDITTSGSSLRANKKILLNAGASSVICFAFSKSS